METFVIVPKDATNRLFKLVLSTIYLKESFELISYVSTEKVEVLLLEEGMIIPFTLKLINPRVGV